MASNNVTIVIKDLERFTERLVVKLVFDIVANLKRPGSDGGTPVDTGWARANWIPRIGGPVPAPRTPGDRASRLLAARTSVGRQEAGKEVVTGYKLSSGAAVWISNGVPYIVRLNAGSSKQAPKNFVQRAIRAAIASVATVRGGGGGPERDPETGRFVPRS